MKKILIGVFKSLLYLIIFLLTIGVSICIFSYVYYQDGYNSVTEKQKEVFLSGILDSEIILTDSGSHRRTGNTFMSIPEWFIVSISDDYRIWLEDGKNPSEFPYFGYLKDYWYLYGRITSIMDYKIPRDYEYHTMVRVIGVSTTLEFGIKGIYEKTLGRITSLTSFISNEDTQYREISREYVDFILLRPWYEFDYGNALIGFDCQLDSLRSFERCLIYSLEFFLKKHYAKVIENAAHANFATPNIWTEVIGLFPENVTEIDNENITLSENGIKISRYYPFTEYFPKVITLSGSTITSIAGNRFIVVESINPTELSLTPDIFTSMPQRIQPNTSRIFSIHPVDRIGEFIVQPNINLSHIYDF